MYIVPMEIPKYCNKCPFGMINYHYPCWTNDSVRKQNSVVDGKENRAGTYGFQCNINHNENGHYTKVMRAKIGEDILKPGWCGLRKVKGTGRGL